MQLEIGLYLSYEDKSAIFSSSSTLGTWDIFRDIHYLYMVDVKAYEMVSNMYIVLQFSRPILASGRSGHETTL